jgi:glyoxylase-like metal-dependent hydrolase (beta-lactamase superfamily II)
VTIEVGSILIRRIVDEDQFEVDVNRLLPGLQLERLARHPWLEPEHADLKRRVLKLSMQAFLVRAGGLLVLVDTCIGEHKERETVPVWHQRRHSRFLNELRAAGAAPDDIDLVFCTHLHADHVGWNTRLEDGRWVPTFPRARYAMSGAELKYWREKQRVSGTPVNHGALSDSVLPVIETGQAIFVHAGEVLAPGLTITGLPGHTPDHLGLAVESAGARVLLCGDAIHTPVQIVEPHWASAFCVDPVEAVRTRLKLLATAADDGLLLVPAHFRGHPVVAVSRVGDGFAPRFLR